MPLLRWGGSRVAVPFPNSVRTRAGYQNPSSPSNAPGVFPPYEWGMVNNPQGGQAPGGHKAQPTIRTQHWIRAQIGTRPIQTMPRGDAGQSGGQVSGFNERPSSQGSSFDGLFQNGSPEPIHIMRFFRAANTGYGGYNSVGRSTHGLIGGTGDNFTVLKRPLQRFPTRGPRSMSGAMNPKSRWDDLGRIPSVFVPSTPLR